MLLVNWITLTLIGFLLNVYLLFEPMVLSVIYVWSQLNRDLIVQFWFGTSFKAVYFPWVLVVFNLIIRGSATMELMGIFVGHVYYFFSHQYPLEYGGTQLLKTPDFLYRLFPVERNFGSGFGVPPPRMRGSDETSSRGFPGRGTSRRDFKSLECLYFLALLANLRDKHKFKGRATGEGSPHSFEAVLLSFLSKKQPLCLELPSLQPNPVSTVRERTDHRNTWCCTDAN
ncbi:Derlin-1 [Taenia crassiceps]|uniref:Derlin n=1 Tax=Taenia crassiceps TaxID=6207 RepID=A0ABR4QA44_9CEST